VPFGDCEMLLEILRESTPDILFIDINLGKTTGIECLQVIKSLPHLSTVPKIVMSTSASNLQIAECVDLGCQYYLQKPNTFNEIITEMQHLFERNWDCN
jgi:CheY-like chemotaxis protein